MLVRILLTIVIITSLSLTFNDVLSQTPSTCLDHLGIYLSLPAQASPYCVDPVGGALGGMGATFGSMTINGDWESDDGTALMINVFPANTPLSGAFSPCGSSTEAVKINSMDAMKQVSTCPGFDTDVYNDEYIIFASDKVVYILYQGLDDYVYNLHHQEFMNILDSLEITNTLPLA